VWALRVSSIPRRRVVNRDLLRVWRAWSLHKNHYSSELNALNAAKAAAEKQFAKAKSAMRTAKRTLTILHDRGAW